MELKNYEFGFRIKAKLAGINDEKIDEYLLYAQKLTLSNLPIIYDISHFSKLVGYTEEYLERAVNSTERFYRYYSIPKKNGGFREIAEPLPSLKEIQRWILDNILYKCSCNKYSKAYIPGNSIKTNARFHKKQKNVLTIDIQNYFPSIRIEKVKDYFLKIGYNENLSSLFASLCSLKECLPQGSPTSPMLSNLITIKVDEEILNLIKPLGIRYSRYADDITLSGDFVIGFVIKKVREILLDKGFEINNKKIRVQGQHERQIVTGVVVNQKLNVSRDKKRDIRQAMYYIKKHGFESHARHCKITKQNYLLHLIGLVNHIIFINPKEKEMKDYLKILYNNKRKLSQGEL